MRKNLLRYNIIYKKGYQQFDTMSSAVTSKVKGLGYLTENGYRRVFDVKIYI